MNGKINNKALFIFILPILASPFQTSVELRSCKYREHRNIAKAIFNKQIKRTVSFLQN
jgi:hypothetical protein